MAEDRSEAVYGTIMRARVKPGHREALSELMTTSETSRQPAGFHSFEVAWEEKDPDRVVVLVHFEDKESYVANAESPEQDAEYRQLLEHLEGEPEWIDVNWAEYVGRTGSS
jgi:quinol monooxygenase YgiN